MMGARDEGRLWEPGSELADPCSSDTALIRVKQSVDRQLTGLRGFWGQ